MFTRTKYGADHVVKDLTRENINAQAIHGNKSQRARQDALDNFKKGKIRVLVATDIAARGIDIDDLSCVFNYDLPEVPETYVHRIGRTGRAGLKGRAIAFCCIDEKSDFRNIQKLTGKIIPVIEDHPYPMTVTTPSPKPQMRRRPAQKSSARWGAPKRDTFGTRTESGTKPGKTLGERDSRHSSYSTGAGAAKPNARFQKQGAKQRWSSTPKKSVNRTKQKGSYD